MTAAAREKVAMRKAREAARDAKQFRRLVGACQNLNAASYFLLVSDAETVKARAFRRALLGRSAD